MSHSHSQTDVDEEQAHFANVIATFQNYAQSSLAANNRRRKDLYTLPKADQELLSSLGYREKLDEVDNAIAANADFLAKVVADPEIFGHDLDGEEEEEVEQGGAAASSNGSPATQSHSHEHGHGHGHNHGHDHTHSHDHSGRVRRRYKPTDFDMDKLRSTLKQLVRDWSAEGREEREACYKPMTDALLRHFANVAEQDRRGLRVLVPGAGLGRLAHDIARLGFASQGNEFSHYMLLTSHFILNRTISLNEHTLYPYIHSFSNLPARSALLRPITVPDIIPGDIPAGVSFSLVAGDFEEIYGAPEAAKDPDEPHAGLWDAVVTCFFIDTAKNIVNYLRIIHRILAPGGVWINLGPLLWHWENNTTHDPSVELSLEEVKRLAESIGFRIENERTIDTTYTNNRESMLGYVYKAAFWTATKAEV